MATISANPAAAALTSAAPSSAAPAGRKPVDVQPFNNLLTTMDETGEQIYALLDQQFEVGRVLAPSESVRYTVTGDSSGVVPGTLTINGTAVELTETYRITVNNFLAGGGDGFIVLTQGANVVNQPGFDVDALEVYLSGEPVSPPGPTGSAWADQRSTPPCHP
jgi:5'-nucleotidase